jgi:hypothetical protein
MFRFNIEDEGKLGVRVLLKEVEWKRDKVSDQD